MLRWFEQQQVFVPSPVLDPDLQALAAWGLRGEEAYFKTGDGLQLHGWFFPAAGNSQRSQLVFLVLHGNGGNICHRVEFYRVWLELGVNLFAFDYRGYGKSEGTPNEPGTYRDAQAGFRWLRKRGFAAERILILGKSLGGGVGSELALRERVGGLILQNTFTSLPDLASELYPWLPVRRLCSIQYDTQSKVPRIKNPVLVLHSREDFFVRFHHAERNFGAANEPKMLWEIRGGHNETLEAGRAEYRAGLEAFLTRHYFAAPAPAT